MARRAAVLRRAGAGLLVAALASSGAACGRPRPETTITLIPKAMDSEFWLDLAEGARSAAAARPDVRLLVIAPDREITYVGTDNRKGGQLAARVLAEALGGQGELALIHGVPGNESQDDRAAGFVDALAAHPGLKLVARQPANSERALGLTVMESILTAHPGVKGVFATNDQMALGAVEAIEARGLRGKVRIVGFDATDEAVTAANAGRYLK